MQTALELLELAAKAAGIGYDPAMSKPDPNNGSFSGLWLLFNREPHEYDRRYWNPLTDDGDALRLAVKLGLFLELYTDEYCLKHGMGSVSVFGFINIDKEGANVDANFNAGDPYAATRSAIVCAAAEIGAKMQGE